MRDCDCDCDYVPLVFYRERDQVARKRHRCKECRHPIEIGDKYTYIAGKGEDFYTVKICLSCANLSGKLSSDLKCFCFGEMIEAIQESDLVSYDETTKSWSSNVDFIAMDGSIPRFKQTGGNKNEP